MASFLLIAFFRCEYRIEYLRSKTLKKTLFLAIFICFFVFWGCNSSDDAGGETGYNCVNHEDCQGGVCFQGICAKTNKENGETCHFDGECKLGYCHVVNTVCATKCSSNKDCASRLCVKGICIEDRLVLGNGDLANDSPCTQNDECESGYCRGGKCEGNCELMGCGSYERVCRGGKCIPLKTQGLECNSNSKIVDEFNILDQRRCSTDRTCCNGFCQLGKCEPGIKCSGDSMCIGSRCVGYNGSRDICGCTNSVECGEGFYCAIKDKTVSSTDQCEAVKPINTPCLLPEECKSGKCSGEDGARGVCVL